MRDETCISAVIIKAKFARCVIKGLFSGEVWVSGEAEGRRRMSPVPRLGLARLARLARLAGVTVLLASIATATAEDTELTTAETDQHTVSTYRHI